MKTLLARLDIFLASKLVKILPKNEQSQMLQDIQTKKEALDAYDELNSFFKDCQR